MASSGLLRHQAYTKCTEVHRAKPPIQINKVKEVKTKIYSSYIWL